MSKTLAKHDQLSMINYLCYPDTQELGAESINNQSIEQAQAVQWLKVCRGWRQSVAQADKWNTDNWEAKERPSRQVSMRGSSNKQQDSFRRTSFSEAFQSFIKWIHVGNKTKATLLWDAPKIIFQLEKQKTYDNRKHLTGKYKKQQSIFILYLHTQVNYLNLLIFFCSLFINILSFYFPLFSLLDLI